MTTQLVHQSSVIIELACFSWLRDHLSTIHKSQQKDESDLPSSSSLSPLVSRGHLVPGLRLSCLLGLRMNLFDLECTYPTAMKASFGTDIDVTGCSALEVASTSSQATTQPFFRARSSLSSGEDDSSLSFDASWPLTANPQIYWLVCLVATGCLGLRSIDSLMSSVSLGCEEVETVLKTMETPTHPTNNSLSDELTATGLHCIRDIFSWQQRGNSDGRRFVGSAGKYTKPSYMIVELISILSKSVC
ncbi:unnamed protein product [Protopolystoma xenopodis]|uniref:Uncharacterized protein n=1 Tax=Protopolystoma xenopodis TaxID=117903 RepID=A0A448XJ10_9PLAT|nr:unnamed protein product [Protopolystoma xenopodis]